MLFYTHLSLGALFFVILYKINPALADWKILPFIFLGSILADIDHTNSKINQWSGPIGKIIVFFARHRGFFHSIFFGGIIFYLAYLAGYWTFGLGLILGHLAHLIGDGLTPLGIHPFYPFSRYNLRGPIRTDSWTEKIFLVILVTVILGLVFVRY
ncbi:metal-dependent hydrolase [Candidatus Woesearchaeota archaeon]|nr:metal-dependent hydrolase [Candidatus Woesearchaeota archaeon]